MNHATREIERGLCTGDERSRKDNCASRLARAPAKSQHMKENTGGERALCSRRVELEGGRPRRGWGREGEFVKASTTRDEVEEVEEGRTNGISRVGYRDAAGKP